MTTKEKILVVIESLDDDVSIEQAIDRLYLLYKIEIGKQQIADGQFVDHVQFMAELEAEELP